MTRVLRDLLDAEEPIFTESIKQLEDITGKTGADIKLTVEITQKAHESMRQMGLEPTLATGPELFAALNARIEQDVERLTKIIGASITDDVAHLVPYMVKAANKVEFPRQVFVLKHEKAKDLLRQMPPRTLMQKLGYKDVEDMFEGEDFDEIYTALRFSEGADWLNRYNELFEQVTPEDYEYRDIRILAMDHNKYVDLAASFVRKKLHNVTHTKEMGIIVVLPMHAKKMRGLVMKTLPLLFHYLNEIKLYSTFFRLKSSKKHFGKIVVETLIADPDQGSQVAGKKIHWRVIQKYLGKHRDDGADAVAFQPHVHPEDLHWRSAADLLYQIDPELEFWKDRDYVALIYDDFPIAFNLVDVSFGYSNGISYEDRYFYHFRESLWNEIFVQYMGVRNLSKQVLEQLDNDMVDPHELPITRREDSVPAIRRANEKENLLIRQRLIDAAGGRLDGVVDEFEHVFEMLSKYDKTVTVFGSKRIGPDEDAPKKAYEIGRRFAKAGYAVITGGGNGIMEAANRGAYEAGGASLGFNIVLPQEQELNDYTTDSFQFQHFFGRKVSLTLYGSGFIFMPGGYGTLDELFEILSLKQTAKIPPVPIILFGSDFWKPLEKLMRDLLLEEYRTIDPNDMEIFEITDDIDVAMKRIGSYVRKHNKMAAQILKEKKTGL